MLDLGIEGLTDCHELGVGTWSMVYSATDTSGRKVAVKVFPNLDEAGRRRFTRERELMERIGDHPGVITPYNFGQTSAGTAYLIMELAANGSVQGRLDEHGPMDWNEAVAIVRPVAEAVRFAHSLGIQHRDIKPSNILLTEDDTPKLTDFGIALLQDATATQSVAFTMAHAAPETFADGQDRRDERSDIYSLASTLYTLVSGTPPFQSGTEDSLQAYAQRVLNHDVPSLDLGVDTAAFFATALAKDPNNRPGDVDAFLEQIDAVTASDAPQQTSARSALATPHEAQPGSDQPAPTPPASSQPTLAQPPAEQAGLTGSLDEPPVASWPERTDGDQPGIRSGFPLRRVAALATILVVGTGVGAIVLSQAGNDELPETAAEVEAQVAVDTVVADLSAPAERDTSGGTASRLVLDVGGVQNFEIDFESASLLDHHTSDKRLFDSLPNPEENLVLAGDLESNGRSYETQVHNGGLEPIIDTEVARSGSRSLRVTLGNSPLLRDDGGVNRRSEIWFVGARAHRDPEDVIENSSRIGFGVDGWYGFSFRLHPMFQRNSRWMISQWRQNSARPPDESDPTQPGSPGTSPLRLDVLSAERDTGPRSALFLSMAGGSNVVDGAYGEEMTTFNVGGPSKPGKAPRIPGYDRTGSQIVRGTWYDVIVGYRFDNSLEDPNGYVGFWISPSDSDEYQLVGEVEGVRIGFGGGSAAPDLALKFGVSSTPSTRARPEGSDESTHTIWFDNVRSGKDRAFVNPKR